MSRRNKLVAGGAALLVAVAAGGAIAATKLTPREERQAVIDDAAKQLGVQPNELSSALKEALKHRVDAAVDDGRLTKEQGERMKQRIEANELPLFALGPRPFHDHRHKGFPPMLFGGKLKGAAEYLGMERRQILEALSTGKTLADLARDRGKSVEGLIEALLDGAEKRLDEAVAAGRLTEAEKQDALVGLKDRITRLVNEGFRVHGAERDRTYFIPPVY
jgi:hypothetical protein